jgi:type 1 fimbria pilin
MVHRMIAGPAVGTLLLIAAPAAARAQAGAGGPQEATVSGTVVDVTCNFTKGVSGDAHRKCGEVCASAGLPLAILGDDGKLYIPLGADAGKPPVDLKAHVDHKVTVKGKVVVSHGANGLIISSVSM